MKTAVICTTRNRFTLFRQTIDSLTGCGAPVFVVDVHSTQGNYEYARELKKAGAIEGLLSTGEPSFYTSSRLGANMALELMPDLDALLITGDDYCYRPGWYEVFDAFMQNAAADVVITTLDMEPAFAWNKVLGVCDAGGYRALLRRTAPGANWAMSRRWYCDLIEPAIVASNGDSLLDHTICNWVFNSGKKVCALNLCTHIGAGLSSYGNNSYVHAEELDFAPWDYDPATNRPLAMGAEVEKI